MIAARNRYWVSPHGKVFELRRDDDSRFELHRETANGRWILARNIRGRRTEEAAVDWLLDNGFERQS